MRTWVKLDARFHGNPKIRRAWRKSKASIGLYVMGLTYAAQWSSDGHVDDDFVSSLCRGRDMERATAALLDAKLWTRSDHGYVIHDYLEWQTSSEEIAAKSAKARAAGRLGGLAKSKRNASAPSSNGERPVYLEVEVEEETEVNTPPNPPASGGEQEEVPSSPPKRPTSGRKRDLEAYESAIDAWSEHWFPDANPRKVGSLVGWMRSRNQTVTADTLREYASQDPLWQDILTEAANA